MDARKPFLNELFIVLIFVFIVYSFPSFADEEIIKNPVRKIFEASKTGDVAKVKKLLKYDPTLISAKNHNGITALHRAALYGKAEVIKVLIEWGADKNSKDDRFGDTPLHKAAWAGHLDAATVLIKSGADPSIKNNDGQTPYQLALRKNNKKVANYLQKFQKKKKTSQED